VPAQEGSAFGFQTVEGVPHFDPAGWDPEVGMPGADVEGRTCLGPHTEGPREGSVPVPGTEPLRCPVW
jgi:hypothetical protein